MHVCCPPGRGCNAHEQSESCALTLLRPVASELREAAVALARWQALQDGLKAGSGHGERRFRQRCYERARENALVALALLQPRVARRRRAESTVERRRGGRRRSQSARPAGPAQVVA